MTNKLHDSKLKLLKAVQKAINDVHRETENRIKTFEELQYFKYLKETEQTLKNHF